MSNAYEIPLQPNAQKFNITLAGIQYQLTVRWNDQSNVWVLDIADDSGNAVVAGIPLVLGVDLLEQYEYMNFGGGLWVGTDVDALNPPGFDGLGTTGHLYFVTTP